MPPIVGVSFDWTDLWYQLVILAMGAVNLVLDNWPIILLIVLVCIGVRLVWGVIQRMRHL